MIDSIDALNDLLMLDHDAVRAYTAAIDRVRVPSLAEKLAGFRTDHERHISDLISQILRMGGVPKSHPDLRGPLLLGFTAFRSLMGDEQALKAVRGNEQLTNREYAACLHAELSGEAEHLVRRNFQDEVRHLAWIDQALLDRIFEEREVHAQP